MDLSVVVCTYNRSTSLRRTLAALEAQEVPPGLAWEIVIVDNNSSDDTRAVVDAFGTACSIPVRYAFEPRQGLSFARNTGVAHAKGEILACTDDDCRPEPTWIRHIVAGIARWSAD